MAGPRRPIMSVALPDGEAWSVLAQAHTGILTTLRADGTPVPTPVWFVADPEHRTILVAGPRATAKVSRIAADPRVSFLVESGLRWDELLAVRVDGTAEIVAEPDWDSFDRAVGAKYAGFVTPRSEMPESSRRRYDEKRALIRITPTRPLVSWDNARLSP